MLDKIPNPYGLTQKGREDAKKQAGIGTLFIVVLGITIALVPAVAPAGATALNSPLGIALGTATVAGGASVLTKQLFRGDMSLQCGLNLFMIGFSVKAIGSIATTVSIGGKFVQATIGEGVKQVSNSGFIGIGLVDVGVPGC